eukprot:2476703-Amphidinium_carterae.1
MERVKAATVPLGEVAVENDVDDVLANEEDCMGEGQTEHNLTQQNVGTQTIHYDFFQMMSFRKHQGGTKLKMKSHCQEDLHNSSFENRSRFWSSCTSIAYPRTWVPTANTLGKKNPQFGSSH